MRTYRIKNAPKTKSYAQRWAKQNLKRAGIKAPKKLPKIK